MNGYRSRLMLLIVTGLFALSGASCPPFRQKQLPLPPVLPPNPSLVQVVEVVNRNNGQIQSFSTGQATLSSQGYPSLRATVAFQREKNFRLHATHSLTGPELDLGSNDTVFWFWVRRNDPPDLFYCRHDQFATSPARHMTPIPPDWLIDALGIGTFDPSLAHQGPYQLPGNRLEIRTIKETAEGPVTKATILDASQGWIVAQSLYNAQGVLLASSQSLGHRRDPRTGLWIPSTVKIQCPSAQFSMQLDLGNVEVNVPPTNPAETFAMPVLANTRTVDIGNPAFRLPGSPPMVSSTR